MLDMLQAGGLSARVYDYDCVGTTRSDLAAAIRRLGHVKVPKKTRGGAD